MTWSPAVPLVEFAPDADPTTQGLLTAVTNVIPIDRGWRSAYSLSDAGISSLTATCCGAYLHLQQDGSTKLYAGHTSSLLVAVGSTWSTICTLSYHANESTHRWRFSSMGDYVLATNGTETIAVSLAGSTFSTIASAPKAKYIESVYGFIMAGATNDATYGDQPDRWWCSGIFDHTSWAPAAVTQCTTGRLVDTPGPITGLRRLGANIVAYKESSMYLGQYVEPPTVWAWTLISSDVGCASHEGIVNIGRAHIFLGSRDAFLYDGTQLQPIGSQIREWFFGEELRRAADARIQAAHDPFRALVYFFYPSTSGTGTLDRALVYSYRLNRWGLAVYPIEAAVDYASTITYDTLGDYFSTYDSGIEHEYDSPFWIDANIVPAVFSGQLLSIIDGPSTTSNFTLWHLGDDQRYNLFRRARIRWLTAPTAATGELYTRDEHGGAFTLRSTVAQKDNKFDTMASSRWHRLKVLTTGTCEFSAAAFDLIPQGDW